MSSESNDTLWDRTIAALKQIVQEEEANNDTSGDEYTHYAKLYVRYTLVLTAMNKVYDSCVQAQKRLDIKMTIEHIICRVIRLRNCLAKLPPPNQSSCEGLVDLSSALVELKISPSQLEALTPLMLKEGNESVSTRIAKMGATTSSSTLEEPDSDANSAGTATLPDNDDEQDDSTSCAQPEIDSDSEKKENIVNTLDDKHAAAKIQALYRGSFARKQVPYERIQIDNFIGMSNTSREEEISQLDADIASLHQQRAQEQSQCQQSYEAELHQLKDTVLEEEGFAMQRELREERIIWITEQTVTKHALPDSLEDFYGKDANQAEIAHDDATTKKELKPLNECIGIYEQRWKGRVVGPDRIKSQAVDSEMAKDLIVRNQVRAELTPGIDEKLLANLQKIKATQEGDKKSKKKEKTAKKGGKKKGGGKKEKPLPGTKLSEVKDMTVQQMLSCLVQNGLVYNYDNRHKISNFIGPSEATGNASTLNAPNAWELRMASKSISNFELASIPSLVIPSSYGPKGSGKTLMMEIVASEIGALVIHLSSTSIGNTFEDGNEATKLIHMIFTVAKEEALSPVIIYLDNCHEFFLGKSKKKGGNPDAMNASMTRFQKLLLIYKNQYLTKEDRVLVIGCTNMPAAGDMKLMKWKGSSGKAEKQGFFEHALYFPNTSNSSRSMLWKEAIRKKVTCPCQLDFDLLAHMSSGYSTGKIFEIVNEVLSNDRLKTLASSPSSEQHDFAPKLLPVEQSQSDQSFIDFRRQWNGSKTKK
eukprot:scaffold12794_cov100-Skeletonema_dohrnii-CCMP3373.AAC.3